MVCVVALCLSMTAISCAREKNDQEKWFKGNLHTHSLWSDGDGYPEMIMDWYKTHNYDFVALSDHNILAEGEKWVRVPDSKLYRDGFDAYLKRFGDEWVEYRVDSGRTQVRLKTLEEYRTLFEDDTFLIIKAEEITDRFEKKPIHVNAINLTTLIPPQGGESVADVLQRNIDAVLKQREETGVPMFPHINHPNFGFAVTIDDMIALRGDRFFEVYNGHPYVHNDGDSLRPSTETMWDVINIAYRKRGQDLIYGLASDDSHNYHQFGRGYANAGRGWVMVRADSLTPASLIRAMEAGRFYASNGVVLDMCRFENNRLDLSVRPAPGVSYEIQFIGAARRDSTATVLKKVKGPSASFDVTSDHLFVRAKVVSSRLKENPFKEGEYEMAWVQPVVFKE